MSKAAVTSERPGVNRTRPFAGQVNFSRQNLTSKGSALTLALTLRAMWVFIHAYKLGKSLPFLLRVYK